MERVWQEFLTIAREEVGSRAVDTWFKAITLHCWDPETRTVCLHAPNKFVCEWVEKNHADLFKAHLSRLLHVESVKVVFVDARETQKESPKPECELTVMPVRVLQRKPSLVKPVASRDPSGVSAHYTFDSFVVGSNNSLAYAAAYAVAENPGRVYNPLFIYGGSGLGKTHLMHAIGNAVRAKNRNAVILYQTTDRFVNEFINAIRYDKVHRFQEKHQSADVLFVDDVQFICNKEQTQEAFFHIFNVLYDARKQIVLSSDTFPQDMQGIAERLRSRFACGLVADIHAPPLETRMAILEKKACANNVTLSEDVLYFIASQDMVNIRELEGALIRVAAFAALTEQEITLELAQKILTRSSSRHTGNGNGGPALEAVARRVCKHFPYDLDDLRAKGRSRDITCARHVAIYLMKKMTHKSLRDIGKFLGGRDHSTVAHALERATRQIKQDADLRKRVYEIERDIARNNSRD